MRSIHPAVLLMIGAAMLWAASLAMTPWLHERPAVEPTPALSPAVEALESGVEPMMGFGMTVGRVEDLGSYFDAVDAMAALGVNAVSIITPIFQEHGASMELARDPQRSPSPDQLEAILEYAGHRGLTTMLMPVVELRSPRTNEWRGAIGPDDWESWWLSYEREISALAELAERAGVDVFSVGAELNSTETMTDHWRRAIKLVRERFDGALVYSAARDRYGNVAFWGEVDLVGVGAFFPLSDRPDATVEAIADRWRELRDQLLTFAARQGRPLLLTQVGYPARPWAYREPWNAAPSEGEGRVETAQSMAYEAFFATWSGPFGRDARFAGFFVHEWVGSTSAPADAAYDPRVTDAIMLVANGLNRLRSRLNESEAGG